MTLEQLRQPNMTDLLAAVKRDVLAGLNCVQIGTIESFDAGTQSASISLNLKKVIAISPDGTQTLQQRPVILECPTFFLFGGSSFISMPIKKGDYCIVLFNDREIDNWFVNGGTQVPTSSRLHDVSDAIALVGIRSLQNPAQGYLADGIRISFDSSDRIDILENAINSLTNLWTHTGNMKITGNLTVEGVTFGNDGSGDWVVNANIKATTLHAANGASGTFNIVTVVNGIVISGS